MPKSPFVLTFGAKNSISYGHCIKIAEYRDFLEIIFELHFRLSLNGNIDRFLEFAARADQVLAARQPVHESTEAVREDRDANQQSDVPATAEIRDALALVGAPGTTAQPGRPHERHSDRRRRPARRAPHGPGLEGLTACGTAHQQIRVGQVLMATTVLCLGRFMCLAPTCCLTTGE